MLPGAILQFSGLGDDHPPERRKRDSRPRARSCLNCNLISLLELELDGSFKIFKAFEFDLVFKSIA